MRWTIWIGALLSVMLATANAGIITAYSLPGLMATGTGSGILGVGGFSTEIAQFDPSLGQLLSVGLDFYAGYVESVTTGALPGSTVSPGGGGLLFVGGYNYGGGSLDGNLGGLIPPYSGGTASASFFQLAGAAFTEATEPGAFNALIGTGFVPWSAAFRAEASFIGVSASLSASGGLTVDYHYIPEPDTCLLVLAGLSGIFVARLAMMLTSGQG